MNIGYCCINTELRSQGIYASRKMNRRGFTLKEAGKRAESNARDLLEIIKWNESHGIKAFRIPSELFPRSSDPMLKYVIQDLSNYGEILKLLQEVGRTATEFGHSLSFHPGQHVCLGSPRESTRKNSVLCLEQENNVADALSADLKVIINIHVGGSYGRKFDETADRFCAEFDKLSPSLQKRIALENDDKLNCWSVTRLHDKIHKRIGIPITFDAHHWHFCNDGEHMENAFWLAKSTWDGNEMQIHYSEPRGPGLTTAHSDFIQGPIPKYMSDNSHIHLECKMKEQAVLRLQGERQ